MRIVDFRQDTELSIEAGVLWLCVDIDSIFKMRGKKYAMYGWMGKVLHVNLSTGEHFVETPEQEVYEKYIGGKGLCGYYLWDYVKLPWDSKDMPLLFFTGPLVGTLSPTSGRMCVMSRSGLTGTVCDCSVGGTLGVQIKRAGFDGVVVSGKSDSLCGIEIVDSCARIVDAKALEGMEVSQCVSFLGEGWSSAVIGPAGENRVLFSNIVVDGRHFAGRGGLGAVMGAKNLKYVKVRGSGRIEVYSKDEVRGAREKILRLSAASPVLQGELGISNYGTGALYDLIHERRMMPTDNFRKTQFQGALGLNAYHYKKRYETRRNGCAGCHILCKQKGVDGEMIPEYETMSHFSALIGNRDMDVVMEANRICTETGMDTISAAGTLACYEEINGKSLSSKEVLKVLYDIAYSRGVGAELAAGSYRYAKDRGCADASVTVKKMELAAYDPRGAYGMALGYVTSTRGGCHLRGYPISHEILRKPVATDRFSFSGKAPIIKISEDLNAAVDSLTACKFMFFAASLEEYAHAFFGVTGVETTAQDLLKAGERIYYSECVMNALNGFSSKDDVLPWRFFSEPGTSGEGIDINAISREDFLRARDDYYKVRGLDADGRPTEDMCLKLGIEWKSF